MRTITILNVLMLVFNYTFGQQAKTEKIKFSSINQAGIVSGSNGVSTIIQSINGINKDGWGAGIGAGFDFYVEKGIQVFLDVRKDLLENNSTPFLYADAGLNFPKINFIQRENRNTLSTSAGLYTDVGGGWKFKIKKSNAILISAGYTFKQSKGQGPTYTYNPATSQSHETIEYKDFRYQRIAIKLGFKF